jgi:hypothetical protein
MTSKLIELINDLRFEYNFYIIDMWKDNDKYYIVYYNGMDNTYIVKYMYLNSNNRYNELWNFKTKKIIKYSEIFDINVKDFFYIDDYEKENLSNIKENIYDIFQKRFEKSNPYNYPKF